MFILFFFCSEKKDIPVAKAIFGQNLSEKVILPHADEKVGKIRQHPPKSENMFQFHFSVYECR